MNELADFVASNGGTLGVSAMLVGVVSILLRQLSTGTLVFKKQLDELRADKDAEIERDITFYDKLANLRGEQADEYRAAYLNEAAARADQAETLAETLELARAADHMLRALPTSKGEGQPPRRIGSVR